MVIGSAMAARQRVAPYLLPAMGADDVIRARHDLFGFDFQFETQNICFSGIRVVAEMPKFEEFRQWGKE
jgi:hypothetical protein